MKYTLIAVVAFLIVIYAYTFIKHRKRKDNQTSTVKEFRQKYLKDTLQEANDTKDFPQGYTPYVTKYNSSIDYVDKTEFLKEINEPQTTANQRKKRKRL